MCSTGCRRRSAATYNHALEYAILQANDLDLPVLVYFGLTTDYPEANARHYAFPARGLGRRCRRRSAQRGHRHGGVALLAARGGAAPGARCRSGGDGSGLSAPPAGLAQRGGRAHRQTAGPGGKRRAGAGGDGLPQRGVVRRHAAPAHPKIWSRFLEPLEESEARIPFATPRPRAPGLDLAAPGAVPGRPAAGLERQTGCGDRRRDARGPATPARVHRAAAGPL